MGNYVGLWENIDVVILVPFGKFFKIHLFLIFRMLLSLPLTSALVASLDIDKPIVVQMVTLNAGAYQ
jgi:hypothetical protein